MRNRILLAIATLALTTLVTTGAQAQDSTGVRAGIPDKPTFTSLIAAINATPAAIEAVKGRESIKASDVTLVNERDLAQGQSDMLLNVNLERHAAEIEELRTALGKHAEVTGLLGQLSPKQSVADVIAVDAREGGKILVYYRGK